MQGTSTQVGSVVSLRTSDGSRIVVEKRAPDGAPRGLLLLTHAMMVDRRSLDRPQGHGLASLWRDAGWEVWLVDFRGHGDAGPSAADGADWSYANLVEEDVPALFREARRAFPEAFVVYAGHSLGGHVGVAAATVDASSRPDAFLLWSTNLWLPSFEPSWPRRRLKGVAMRAMSVVTKLGGRFPSRLLRVGPADEAARYVEELTGMWYQDSWPWHQGVRSLTMPILSILGSGDRLLAHADGAVVWAAQLGPSGAEVWIVGAGDHGLTKDPGHMSLVTDGDSTGVWRAAMAWCDRLLDEDC